MMASEAKANEASCFDDRIIVTGAVIMHNTWKRERQKYSYINKSYIYNILNAFILVEDTDIWKNVATEISRTSLTKVEKNFSQRCPEL